MNQAPAELFVSRGGDEMASESKSQPLANMPGAVSALRAIREAGNTKSLMVAGFWKEVSSLSGDPLFNDPENGDFGFQPGSPAIELGIEPFDASKMGRLK